MRAYLLIAVLLVLSVTTPSNTLVAEYSNDVAVTQLSNCGPSGSCGSSARTMFAARETVTAA